MRSTSETGHAKNVANLETLITYCVGYGAPYNPSMSSLTIVNLVAMRAAANAILQTNKVTKTNFDNATINRRLEFKDVKPLSTRTVNALDASGVPPLVVENARVINRKIQGTTTKNNTDTELPPIEGLTNNDNTPIPSSDNHHSTSQQSYDSIIDNFKKLLEIVTQQRNYAPNEADLSLAGLQVKIDNMIIANTAVKTTQTSWSNARIQRDELLYADATGLVPVAQDVKKYIKSLFTATSPQYKQVSKIQFKDLKGK